jgi:hypothetical protein
MVLRRAGLRQDAFVRLYQVAGVFGPSGTCDELQAWLADAGMLDVSTPSDGALAYFPPAAMPSRRTVTGDRARSSATSNTQTSDSDSVAESSASVQSLSTSSCTHSTPYLAPATSLEMLRWTIWRSRSSTPARIGPERTIETSPPERKSAGSAGA